MKKCTSEGIGRRKLYKRCLAFILAMAIAFTGLPMNMATVSAKESKSAEEPSTADVTYVSITPNHQEVVYSENLALGLGYDITKLFNIDGVTLDDLEHSTDYTVEIVENETTATYENPSYNAKTYRYSFTPTSTGRVVIRLVVFENQEAGISRAEAAVTCTIHKGDVNTNGYYIAFNDGKKLVYGTDTITANVYKMNGDECVSSEIKVGEEQTTDDVEFRFAPKGEKEFTTDFPTEVGTYDVKALVKTSELWNEFAVEGELVITAKPLSINVTTEPAVYSYGDEELGATYSSSFYKYDLETLKGNLGFDDTVEDLGLTFSTEVNWKSEPGHYKIDAAWTNPNYTVKVNYDEEDHTTGYVNIQPKEVTVTWKENVTYSYNYAVSNNAAVVHSVENNVVVEGILFEDDVTLQYENARATLPGEYVAKVLPELAGAKANCYKISNSEDALKHNWKILYAPVDGYGTPKAVIEGTTSDYVPEDAVRWYSGDVALAVPAGYEIPLEISLNVNTGWDEAVDVTNRLEEGKNEFTYYLRVPETGIIITKETVEVYYDDTAPSGELTYKDVKFDTFLSEYSSRFFANKKSAVSYEGTEEESETASGLAAIEYRIINRTNDQVSWYGDAEEWIMVYQAETAGTAEAGKTTGFYNFIPNTGDLLIEARTRKPQEPRWEDYDSDAAYEQAYKEYEEKFQAWYKEWVPNAAVGHNIIEMRFTDWAGNQKVISSDDIIVFDTLYPHDYDGVDYTKLTDEIVEIYFEDDEDDYLYFPFSEGDKYISKIAIKGAEEDDSKYVEQVVGTNYTYYDNALVINGSAFEKYPTDTSCIVKIDYKPYGLTVVDQYSETAKANDKPESVEVTVNIKKIQGKLEVNHVKGGEVYEKVYDGLPYGDFSYQMPYGMDVEVSYVSYPWKDTTSSTSDPVDSLQGWTVCQEMPQDMPKDAGKYIAKFELKSNENVEGCVEYKRFEIKPRPVTATMTVESKNYDNKTDAKVATVTVDTGVEGKELFINPAAVKAEFADANVGLSKEVSFKSIEAENRVKPSSDKYENYVVTYNVARADIKPRPVTITLPDVSSVYGENPSEAIYVKQEDGTTKLVYETVDGAGNVIPVTGVVIETAENPERGLLEEHTYADLKVSNYTTTATSKSNVIRDSEDTFVYGGYPVSAKVGNKNYNVTFAGKMIIEPKEAELEWDYVPATENSAGTYFTTRNYVVKAKVTNIINNNRFTLAYETTKDGATVDKAIKVGAYVTKVTALGNTNYKLPDEAEAACSWEISDYNPDNTDVTVSTPDGTVYNGKSDVALLEDVATEDINGWYRMTNEIMISAPAGYMICEHVEKDGEAIYEWDSEIVIDNIVDGYHAINYHLRNMDTLYVTDVRTVYIAVDQTSPTGRFKVGEKEFRTELGEFLYKLFFKNTTEITVNWAEGTSGVCKVEYAFLEAGNDVEAETVNWVACNNVEQDTDKEIKKTLNVGEDGIPVEGWEKFVYVRFTDRAGNRTIINSSGLVLYTDSVYAPGEGEEANEEGYVYTKFSKTDLSIPVISDDDAESEGVKLYDNTVKGIKITGNGVDTISLQEGIDYEVTNSNIVISYGVLDKLAAKHTGEENYRDFKYSIDITVNPRGYDISEVQGDADAHVDEPSIVSVSLYVKKATASISAHEYHKVYDGKEVVNPSYATNSDGEASARYYTQEIQKDDETSETEIIYHAYKDENGNWIIPKDAGEYWVEYSVAESELYYAATAKDKVKIVVEKRPVNVYIRVASKVYDGNKSATIPSGENNFGFDGSPAGVFIDTGVSGEKFVYESGIYPSFKDEKVGKNKEIVCTYDEDSIVFGEGTTADLDNYDMKFIENPAAIVKRPVALQVRELSREYDAGVSTGNIFKNNEYTDVSIEYFKGKDEKYKDNVGIVAGDTNAGLDVYYEGERKDVGLHTVPAKLVSIESAEYDVTLVEVDTATSTEGATAYKEAENVNLRIYERDVEPIWITETSNKGIAGVRTRLFHDEPSGLDGVLPYNGEDIGYAITLAGVTSIVEGDEGYVKSAAIDDAAYIYRAFKAEKAEDDLFAIDEARHPIYPIKYQLVPEEPKGDNGDRTFNYIEDYKRYDVPGVQQWSIYYLDEYYKTAREVYAYNPEEPNVPADKKENYKIYDELYKDSTTTHANGSAWKTEEDGTTVSWYNTDIVMTAQKEGYLISDQNKKGYNQENWKDSMTYTEEGQYNVDYALMDEEGSISSLLSQVIKIDKTDPTGKLTVKKDENKNWIFKETLLGKLLFDIFIAEEVTVTVEAGDVIGSTSDISRIKSVEYQLVETADTDFDDTKWTLLTDKEAIEASGDELDANGRGTATVTNAYKFTISADKKAVVYVKVTDNAENVTIINSDGIVVFSNEEINKTHTGYTFKESYVSYRLQEAAIVNYVTTNDYPIAAVTCNGMVLKGEDYTFEDTDSNGDGTADGDSKVKKFTLKEEYISTLKANTYTISIKYKPVEEEYIGTSVGDEPERTSFTVDVKRQPGEVKLDDSYKEHVYSGKHVDYPIKITSKSSGERTFEFKKPEEANSAYTTNVPIDAGTYVIRVTVAQDDNYEEAYCEMEFKILPKEVIVEVPIYTKEYDGTVEATVIKSSYLEGDTGIVGEELDIYSWPECEFTDPNAGTDKEITCVSDSWVEVYPGTEKTKVENYTLTYVAAEGTTILPKAITVTPEAAGRVYGDANPELQYDENITGIVGEDELGTVVLTTTAEVNSNVGTYDIVLAEEAEINSNYKVVVAGDDLFTVTERPVTVVWPTEAVIYNAKEQNYIPTVGNVVEGDDVQFTYVYYDEKTDDVIATPIEAGDYTTFITGLTGTSAGNYVIADGTDRSELWSIVYAELPEDAKVDIDESKWYNEPIVLNAPQEYDISTDGSNPDTGWVSSVTFNQEADDENGVEFTYYLKDRDTGAITPVTVTLKLDQTAPTGMISIKDRDFATIIDEISYRLFYKYEDNFKAVFTVEDTNSGIAKIEYMMAQSYEEYEENRNDEDAWSDIAEDKWTVVEDEVVASVSLQPTKTAIFVRITDNAGNRIEMNSDGIVVYVDSVVDEDDVTYVKTTKASIAIPAELNGNTIKSVVIGKETLVLGEDYRVEADPETVDGELIVLSGTYLEGLAAKEEPYNVVISFAPQNATFVEELSKGDAPEVSELKLFVKMAEIGIDDLKIVIPDTNVYNGKAVDVAIETKHNGKQTVYYREVGTEEYSTVAPKDAGEYELMVVIEADGVYKTSEVTKGFTIVPREVTVNVTPVSAIYGDTVPNFIGSVSGTTPMAEGENYGTLKLSLWAEENEQQITGKANVGTYKVTGSAENKNYDVTVNGTGAYVVQPRALSIQWPASVYKYTAREQVVAPEIVNLVTGDNCKMTVVDNKKTEANVYTAEVTAIDNANYTLEGATGLTWNWSISYNEDAVDITVNGEQPSDRWFAEDILIQAPEGYLVSTQNTDPDNGWVADMTLTEETVQNVTYYLKKISDGSITSAKNWTAKIDRTTPTGIITIEGNAFKKFINEITFGYFFKNTADVVIEAADTASGVVKVEYQMTAGGSYTEAGWKEYEEFSVDTNQKFVVYARITDGAGNRSVINTDGIVVYEDVVTDEETILTYVKTTKEAVVIPVDLNGNTVKSVVIGKDTLVLGEDYTLETDPEAADVKLIVISGDYLEKQQVKEDAYVVEISYCPQGVEFIEGTSRGDVPKVSKFELYVVRAIMEIEDLLINMQEETEYTGKAVEFTIETEHTGKQTVYYKPVGAQDSEYTTIAPTNVGDYVLKVVLDNDGKYKEFEKTQEFSIVPREVTVNVTPVSATYGDAVPAFVGVVSERTPMADGEHYGTLKMSLWAVENEQPITGKKDVGEYDVTGESGNPNYDVTVIGTDAYQIQPRSLVIHWTEGVYMYTAKEQSVAPVIRNLVAGDSCNMTVIEDRKTAADVYTAVVTAIDNDNYTLEGATSITWNWSISYNTDNVNITINDEQPSEAWYTEDIKIQAPEGYLLSTQNTDADNGWTADMTVVEEKAQNVTYYLKKLSDGSITDARTWVAKIDRTAPTGTITVKGNAFKTLLNDITFGYFFKNTADVIIEAVDTTSGIAKVEYQISADDSYTEDGWQEYEKFAVNANQKFVVYARITDNAGFVTIINSNGVVVYTDSVARTDNVSFTKTSTEDVTASVMLNGNTIKEVKNGTYTLTAEDYSVAGEVIILKASYLNTLTAGNHVLEVTYNPLGLNYAETATGTSEAPNSTFINVRVDKKVLPAGQGATLTDISDEMKYDGTAVAPQVDTVSTGNMTIYYKEADASDDTYTTEAPKNTGDYVVRVVIEADENYEEIVVEKEFTIAPMAVKLAWSDNAFIYNEEQREVTATVTNAISGDEFVLEYTNNQKTEVGTYVAEVVGLGNDNYTLVGAQGATCEWFISYSTDPEAEKITTGSVEQPSVEGWYRDTVTITAPEGYVIKTDDMESWEDQIQISEDGAHTVTIYVKHKETGEVSKLDDIVVKVDKTAPEGTVTVLDNTYNTEDEATADSYVVFRKEAITGTIVGNDELDPDVTVEYQKVADAELYDPNGDWTEADEFTVVPGETAVVYVRFTDAAGNVTVVNSAGMVVYEDAQAKTTEISYTKGSKKNVAAEVILNGNTVAKVTNGNKVLTPDVDYTVDADGKITFKSAYLNSLKEGKYTFEVSYNPLGKAYVDAEGNQSPATTTLKLSVENVEQNTLKLNEGLKVDQTGKEIKIRWGEVSDADGYNIYVQYCGTKFKKTPTITNAKVGESLAATTATITKVNGKKLDLKKNFKVYVEAYKFVDGEKVVVGKTVKAHVVGKNNKNYTNVKEVKVSKSKYTLSVGKTAKISAKTVLVEPGKKQLPDVHAKEFRYASSNEKVAVVSASGKITAKGKGTCTIYVYARNGYAKKVTVKVK